MGNTDPTIISEYTKILKILGINYHCYNQQSKPHHKIATIVKVSRLDMLAKFLPIIIPYLRAKQSRAELLLQLVISRLKKGNVHHLPSYNEEELSVMDKLGELNQKGCQRLNGVRKVISVSDSPHCN